MRNRAEEVRAGGRVGRVGRLAGRSGLRAGRMRSWRRPAAALAACGLGLLALSGGAALMGPVQVGAQAAPPEAYGRVATWRTDPADLPPEAFLAPAGVDADMDPFDRTLAVYVVDGGNARVQVFDAAGGYLRTIGGAGAGAEALAAPRDVAAQGSLVFVSDESAGRVAVFSTEGAFVSAWTGLEGPAGIAVAESGQVYVVENGASRVARFNADGSRAPGPSWGSFGSGFGQLNRPGGAAFTADGRLVVADSGNDRLMVFQAGAGDRGDPVDSSATLPAAPLDLDLDLATGDIWAVLADGTLRRFADRLGLPQQGAPLALTGARGIAFIRDAAGEASLYASFQDDARPLHGVRRWLGSPPAAPAEGAEWGGVPAPLGRIEMPFRVAYGSGAALLADRWPRVQLLDAAGRAQRQLAAAGLNDMAAAADGTLFVATDDAVLASSADGSPAWRHDPALSGGDYAWLVALGYDEAAARLSVLDLGGQRLIRLGPDGRAAGGWSFRPAPGAATTLWDLALAGSAVYTVNRSADTLERRDAADGRVLAAWPVPGRPLRVAADAAGQAYVLNWFGWVLKYAPDGGLRAAWPVAAPGEAGSEPTDLALDPEGRVLVADGGLDQVAVFAPDPAGQPVALPDFEPACRATGAKRAEPSVLWLGEEATVTLEVGGSCPALASRSDVLLVLDHSGSMAGAPLDAAKDAAKRFVDQMDLGQDRVGVVAFNQAAQLVQPLTGNASNARAAIDALQAGGGTDIAAGLDAARRELTGPRRRAAAASVIVLLTDGQSAPLPAQRAADQAKLEGARIFTIGLGGGVNQPLLAGLASGPTDAYLAPGPADLAAVYQAVARRIVAQVLFTSLTVTDLLPGNMAYVAGSGVPEPQVNGQALVWSLSDVPFAGLTLRYRVRPLETGTHPTNLLAFGEGGDGLGRRGRVDFPVPSVRVLAAPETPGPTPSPAATPSTVASPSPSPTPAPIYLPLLKNEVCLQRRQHADVVLLIDSSDSMRAPTRTGRSKLEAALAAARAFVGILDLGGGDAAGLVEFNTTATERAPLSHDTLALQAALAHIQHASGTRIDLGLIRAGQTLAGPGRSPANAPVLVLLTDGRPSGTTDAEVIAAADALKAQGTLIYAVGLGEDVDGALLARIASGPGFLALTPDAEELSRIYAEIARELPCIVP